MFRKVAVLLVAGLVLVAMMGFMSPGMAQIEKESKGKGVEKREKANDNKAGKGVNPPVSPGDGVIHSRQR